MKKTSATVVIFSLAMVILFFMNTVFTKKEVRSGILLEETKDGEDIILSLRDDRSGKTVHCRTEKHEVRAGKVDYLIKTNRVTGSRTFLCF